MFKKKKKTLVGENNGGKGFDKNLKMGTRTD